MRRSAWLILLAGLVLGESALGDEPVEGRKQPRVIIVELKLVKVVKLSPTSITVQDGGNLPHEYPFQPGYLKLNSNREVVLGFLPHRVSDIQVGDIVGLDLDTEQGVELCRRVGIFRRPGGKVPPAIYFPRLPEENRWHNQMNAEQFAEEKVFPWLERSLRRYTWQFQRKA